MRLSRRTILRGAGALPLLANGFTTSAFAQTPAAPAAAELPPILFVHGNGDHAALWMTTMWRMESNGVARERRLKKAPPIAAARPRPKMGRCPEGPGRVTAAREAASRT